jgi:hypothetical protein
MRMLLVALASVVAVVGAAAEDLADGVLITHCPPGLSYTATPQDWCAGYAAHAIRRCDQQATRVDVRTGVVWYVLSAWPGEGRTWCGMEFGLGPYEPGIWAFAAFGPCGTADVPLEIPMDGWPGPNRGTAIASTGQPWSGNFTPVYFFAGYAYYPGTMPLAPHPRSGFVGWAGCEQPPLTGQAVCLGAVGLFQDGRACCPPPPPRAVCCLAADCLLLPADECRARGGAALTQLEACGSPDPCSLLRAALRNAIRSLCP